MSKLFHLFVLLLPIGCFAQISISGRVLNKADNKPVANASVYLSNATIGTKTAADGTFTLRQVTTGKYELVITIVGFEGYIAPIIAGSTNMPLADIRISPKAISLNEVVIKPDNNRDRNLQWFRDQFLGTSDLARQCKILNPNIIDLDYNETTQALTAATPDFLEIENYALGYKIKYLITNFSFTNKDFVATDVFYKGSVLFEEMKGTPAQESQWKINRKEVYQNSEMHFLRALLTNTLVQEGFSTQLLSITPNPERPTDDLINTKIAYFAKLKQADSRKNADSLAFWERKAKLPKNYRKLIHIPLDAADILSETDKPGLYALGCDNDGLYINYGTSHRFNATGNLAYVNTPRNTENTLIGFNTPYLYFYRNGVIANPYGATFYGVWGRNRVAELLPINYFPEEEANQTQPADSSIAKNITTKVKAWADRHTAEKAYLHFDKPYYAAGDTMYFKAYVTQGDSNKLSGISGVLHVNLVNEANKTDQSLLLKLDNGLAWGDFALPDSLPQGNYHVKAYTNWMLNDGPDNYFDKTIPIGAIHARKIPEAIAQHPRQGKPDVQFFPEGGRLVNGIASKIAFKAVGSNGLGIDFKGEVVDNENNPITSFASTHLGMGYFSLTPTAGKTYKAKFGYADGSSDAVDLPLADADGVVLSVDNSAKTSLLVTVASSPAFYRLNKNKSFTVISYSAGKPSPVICKLDNPIIKLNIDKQNWRSGIASVTLFSPLGGPLSERLVFVQNNDQLNIHAESEKTAYTPREKVNIKLNVKNDIGDAIAGHFSVSVIDESKVPADENTERTIFTNFLLTSELKGFVEQPNYYFANSNEQTNANLDLVMLTHGYRRFEWKKLLNNQNQPAGYNAEQGIAISGTVTTRNGKPIAYSPVSLLPMNSGPVLTQQANANGAFRFGNLTFIDTGHFVLKGVNPLSKNNIRVNYNSNQPPVLSTINLPVLNQDEVDSVITPYVENRKQQLNEEKKYGPLKGIALKQVNIKARKDPNDYLSSNLAGPGAADQVIHRKDFQGTGSFTNRFNGRLLGLKFEWVPQLGAYRVILNTPITLGENPSMMLVIDGIKMQQLRDINIDDINVDEIETIEVLRNPATAAIYGALGGGGVLIITTRRDADDPQSQPALPGILPISPRGYYKAREFYAPKYDHEDANFKRKDLRSTIYWSPELVTDASGNASFSFYNADGIGSYRVIIEGIDDNGDLGRQVIRYTVR